MPANFWFYSLLHIKNDILLRTTLPGFDSTTGKRATKAVLMREVYSDGDVQPCVHLQHEAGISDLDLSEFGKANDRAQAFPVGSAFHIT